MVPSDRCKSPPTSNAFSEKLADIALIEFFAFHVAMPVEMPKSPPQTAVAPTNNALEKPTTPPPCALPLLARAYILLHTSGDICSETEYGAIATCAVMVYGVTVWKLAQKNARSTLIDEEEGMVLVDFEVGRGEILNLEVKCDDEDEDDDEEFEDTEQNVADEVKTLVAKAVAEIKNWDSEVGKRVGFAFSVLKERHATGSWRGMCSLF